MLQFHVFWFPKLSTILLNKPVKNINLGRNITTFLDVSKLSFALSNLTRLTLPNLTFPFGTLPYLYVNILHSTYNKSCALHRTVLLLYIWKAIDLIR